MKIAVRSACTVLAGGGMCWGGASAVNFSSLDLILIKSNSTYPHFFCPFTMKQGLFDPLVPIRAGGLQFLGSNA